MCIVSCGAYYRERLYFVCIRADLVDARRERQNTAAAADENEKEEAAAAGSSSSSPSESFSPPPSLKFPWPGLPDLKKTVQDILEPEDTVPASLTLDEHRWAKVSGSS